MAKLAIELEKNKAEKTDTFKSISDFIVSYIDPVITIESIQNLIFVKYGVFPNNVRWEWLRFFKTYDMTLTKKLIAIKACKEFEKIL